MPLVRKTAVPAVLAVALAVPAAAGAHVTLQPAEAPAGAFTVLDVRVPNERDDASTTKVDVQMPRGFAFVSYKAVPGWTTRITRSRLETPISTPDGDISEAVTRVTFTGRGAQGRIAPGQFQDFPLSVQVPGRSGDTLTFKALQTYDDGEVVRWIGGPDNDEPAPRVRVTAAQGTGAHGANAEAADDADAAATGATTDDDDGASTGLVIAALVLGTIGALTGLAALLTARRRPARA